MSPPRILVVGAGPTGLALAGELFRHGVECRIVDRDPGPHTESRATDVHPKTLELMHKMGVLEEVHARGTVRREVAMYSDGDRIAHIGLEDADTPYPHMLGIAQSDTEAVLESHLHSLGGRVERSVRLATLVQDPEGVTPVLLHPDGRYEEPRFDYVVGCDGAHSAVRKAIGLQFLGSTFDESFLLFDAKLEWDQSHELVALYSSRQGMIGALPLPHGWIRFFGDVDTPPAARGTAVDPSVCREMLATRLPIAHRLVDLGWSAYFRIHTRMVEQYRKDRVFLAGDAAHIHSPAGGFGMNLGIQDAGNLGWKLALVARGHAPAALLESYEPERHPVAKAVCTETDMSTRVGLWRNPVARGLVSGLIGLITRLPPIRQRMISNALELGYDYRASPISGEHRASIMSAPLTHSNDSERASLGDALDFGSAPHAGDRAPDVLLAGGPRLYDRLRGPEHVLLLLDGQAHTADGYRRMAEIATEVRRRHPARIRPVIVIHGARPPEGLPWDGDVWLDAEASLHKRYGAAAECLYLIRPDGHISFRAQPLALQPLLTHLSRYLT